MKESYIFKCQLMYSGGGSPGWWETSQCHRSNWHFSWGLRTTVLKSCGEAYEYRTLKSKISSIVNSKAPPQALGKAQGLAGRSPWGSSGPKGMSLIGPLSTVLKWQASVYIQKFKAPRAFVMHFSLTLRVIFILFLIRNILTLKLTSALA